MLYLSAFFPVFIFIINRILYELLYHLLLYLFFLLKFIIITFSRHDNIYIINKISNIYIKKLKNENIFV